MVAIEQTYRYRGASEWAGAEANPDAYLATSGGEAPHPYFFSGFVGHARRDAQLLMTVGRVASSRFHLPSAMVAATVRAADPVVTCDGDRLRFEAFSACNGVYARLDLERLEGEVQGVGTTNVDFNSRFQHALAGVRATELVHLAVGLDEVRLARLGGTVVERKVALPDRWIRGFAEVALAQERMVDRFALETAATRRFLGEVARGTRKVPVWVGGSTKGLKIGRLPTDGAVPVAGLDRLSLLADHARYATSLRVFQDPGAPDGESASGWELAFGDARLTIVVSPARNRGFSGEGTVLTHLTGATVADDANQVAGRLAATRHQSLEEVTAGTGLAEERARAAVALLGAQGVAGFDRGLGRWFMREMPFDLDASARLHPRLREAQRLVETGSVRLHHGLRGGNRAASVVGDHGCYDVSVAGEHWTCGCQWFRDHGTARGPCKHVLAVLLSHPGNGEAAS